MLGGVDNPNGELPSYITGADTCADVSKISHPQLVRSFCHELTVYAVACGKGFPADGRTDLFTPENTGKSHNRHETCHSASGHSDTFP
ncbi:InsB [Shigella sonnei]|nr:InsB [Shigella sonnei]SJE26992.1 InsB [Shigella sonnei]